MCEQEIPVWLMGGGVTGGSAGVKSSGSPRRLGEKRDSVLAGGALL